MRFFHLRFSFGLEVFVVLVCYGNVCSWTQKLIWPRMGWFWSFCWKMPHFFDFITTCTDICKNSSSFFPIDDIKCFRYFVCGGFWSVLWICLYLLATGFCNNNGRVLAMQKNFVSYLFGSSFPAFPKIMMKKHFDFFWKPISQFSKFLSDYCLLMLCFLCCITCFSIFFNRAC